MATIGVIIKHGAKAHTLSIRPDDSLDDLKAKIWQQTGVPPEKQKVVLKGVILKDHKLSAMNVKDGQVFNVIGNAGPLPPPPVTKTVFLEDMDDEQLANAKHTPSGLENLGNTCYMNSSLQLFRHIPELGDALKELGPASNIPEPLRKSRTLVSSMKLLFESLSSTTQPFSPTIFLQALRDYAPQFGEMARSRVAGREGEGFAQQDAEECWGAIVTAMKQHIPGTADKKWVDQWMQGQLTTITQSSEAPIEDPVSTTEPFLELKCNISVTTNFLMSGIKTSLQQTIEKHSPSLGRSALYHQESKISRLPGWLTIHLVRFYWRREINKKAKIMRKVKFPFELNLLELVTDDLKNAMTPLNQKMQAVDRERLDRANMRKKLKRKMEDEARERAINRDKSSPSMEVDEVLGGADEESMRKKEDAELACLIAPSLRDDIGANYTGIYELWGIVTHKGASADGGHYVAWTRKNADSDEWYCFDDDRVTVIDKEKVGSLDGGGEDHTAYILLYKSRTVG